MEQSLAPVNVNNNKPESPVKKMGTVPPIKYSSTMPHPRKGVWCAGGRAIPSLTTGKELRQEHEFLVQTCSSTEERVSCQLKMLRRELKAMRMQDQLLLRQLLRIYAMINDLYGNAQDRSPSNQQEAPIMADEVADLLTQSGHLDIRDIVSRLSPLRRRRGSDPEALHCGVTGMLEFEESDVEDVFSMSCPIFI
ncbi:uncharacterized protein LOC110986945 [Acanthaster planci]|uniref:Uncharacterized protein LOC110986945 n=1 Tax=Acanthaster planci TaxID=133434 RepID=A0A8B7ZJD1_ACAPL|nr:uncharacterized protein LOC110986945 [Acanthaster planci]